MQTIVHIYSKQRDISIRPLRKELCRLVREVLLHEQVPPTRITLTFITDQETRKLHLDHFDDPTSTDCMTFPVDDVQECALPSGCLGEVYICPRTAILQAIQHKTSPTYELALYVIHGVLHLLGYDDMTPSACKAMRAKERHYLDLIYTSLHTHR